MNYLETLKYSIIDMIDDFQCSPFDYFYEADIQATLFAIARAKYHPEKVEMIGGYHPPDYYPKKNYAIRTTPIKCEYPSGQRFDIAVIDQHRVESYEQARWEQNNWKNDRFWAQPLCAAVEIKFMQFDEGSNDRRAKGLMNDVNKLRTYRETDPKFTGIALLFVQTDRQYSEKHFEDMKKLEGISEVDNGIYAAIIAPSNVSWYRQ